MDKFAIAAVILAIAALIATQLSRRKPEPPTQRPWTVPQQLDRADFERPDAPWLVAVFTSATCAACERMRTKAEVLRSDSVAVQFVDYTTEAEIHNRYGIDAVPTIVIADVDGVVARHFIGPASATDLWAAVAELREPGSTPPPDAHTPR